MLRAPKSFTLLSSSSSWYPGPSLVVRHHLLVTVYYQAIVAIVDDAIPMLLGHWTVGSELSQVGGWIMLRSGTFTRQSFGYFLNLVIRANLAEGTT